MSRIKTYSPEKDARIIVQGEADSGVVSVGVQRASRPAPSATEPDHFDDHGGAWSDLDRAGVNNLIRALRDMRNKAFGKDE